MTDESHALAAELVETYTVSSYRGPALLICSCTHSELGHKLSTDGSRRTACQQYDGVRAVPCRCARFDATHRTVIEYRTIVEPLGGSS